MTTNLVPFDMGTKPVVPAHIQSAFADKDNVPEKLTVPQLSFRGKIWRIVLNGEETPLMRKDPDTGDSVPVNVLPLVVLDFNKLRSRAYYEGAYEEGKKKAPTCRSQDGKIPDADVQSVPFVRDAAGNNTAQKARTCAECPMSVKGSKVNENGTEGVACQGFKNLAVVPASQIDKFPPLRLRLAQTSIWDKDNNENEAQGWYAFDQFVDFIRGRGVKHSGQILVKVKFDHRPAHPKLLFKADAWLGEAQVAQVLQVLEVKKSDVSKALSIDEQLPAATPETEAPAATAAPVAPPSPAPAPVAPPVAPVRPPVAPPVSPAAPKRGRPSNASKAATQATPAPQAVVAEDGDPFASIPQGGAQAAPAPAPAPAARPVPVAEVIPAGNATASQKAANLAGLLKEWDD